MAFVSFQFPHISPTEAQLEAQFPYTRFTFMPLNLKRSQHTVMGSGMTWYAFYSTGCSVHSKSIRCLIHLLLINECIGKQLLIYVLCVIYIN